MNAGYLSLARQNPDSLDYKMMKKAICILSLTLIVAGTAHARKLVPRYENFKNIALTSSTNRFDKAVYVGGWVNSGADVLQWADTLTLEKLLAACGGKMTRQGDTPEEWQYTLSIYRPTEKEPNPRKAFLSIQINQDTKALADTKLKPEDAVLVTRQKKEKSNK
jgi:hypothetical protein